MTATVLALLALSAAAFDAPDHWTATQAPYRIHGNSYYVGSVGLASILITDEAGHVLIDAPMDENIAPLLANVRALGFDPKDVRLIVFSHAHFDHAGGAAQLVQATGAEVHSSAAQAVALRSGGIDPNDPQFGMAITFPEVAKVTEYAAGEALEMGATKLTGHASPGHTPGSTTWSWRSCEQEQCIDMVYADSLTPIGTEQYRYSDPEHPERLQSFRAGLATIAALPCDLLITPHPEASGYDKRRQRQLAGVAHALIDDGACRAYAERAEERLRKVVAREQEAKDQPRSD